MQMTWSVVANVKIGDEIVGSVVKILNDYNDAIEYAELWTNYKAACHRLEDYNSVYVIRSDSTNKKEIFNVW